MELQDFHNVDGMDYRTRQDAILPGYDIVRVDSAYYVVTDGDTLRRRVNASFGDETYEAALDDLFARAAWPGGYAIAWFNAGDCLCPRCARQEYEADEDTRTAFRAGEWFSHVTNSDDTYHGVQCDNCQEWIVAPACVICGNDLTDERANGVWYEPNGDRQVCAECMAAALDAGTDAETSAHWQAIPRDGGAVELQYHGSYEGMFEQ